MESLPNITGNANACFHTAHGEAEGVFAGQPLFGNGNVIANASSRWATFDASLSNTTYQDNAPVRPFSMSTAFLIRY